MEQIITRKVRTCRKPTASTSTPTQASACGGDVPSIAEACLGQLQKLIADVDRQIDRAREIDEQLHGALLRKYLPLP